jgi:Na+-translocating ferredoxin:NAD+ oxidoreductase subunit D
MFNRKKFIVSHAPFWHNGSGIAERSYHTLLAALPAAAMGVYLYGMPALAVLALSMASAVGWEILYCRITKQPETVLDGNAAVIGLMFGMLLPPVIPWWVVVTGTFIAVIIAKQIYGGIGGNPFNPPVMALAIVAVSWGHHFKFDLAALSYDLPFARIFPVSEPLAAVKHAGKYPELFDVGAVLANFSPTDLLMGQQLGGIGATFGLGLILGGLYLILRGFIRWEISLSFLAGIAVTALAFHMAAPEKYVGPVFHLLTGYTLLGAFFLATEDSSSPVGAVPMLIFGATAGVMTMLIRNIGAYADGVMYGILIANLINPLLDKIRPKALGKVA